MGRGKRKQGWVRSEATSTADDSVEFRKSRDWYDSDGQFHREDGPARIHTDSKREWFVHGLKHREDGPAVEWDGNCEWWLNGSLHREDGPAIEWAAGDRWWFRNGLYHREDGPAIEDAKGGKAWWLNDRLHREDGPAIVEPDGTCRWYLEGRILSEAEWRTELEERALAGVVVTPGQRVRPSVLAD